MLQIKSNTYNSYSHCNYVCNNDAISSSVRKDAYFQRLCAETDYTYNTGGIAIMLLFTYNSSSLPFVCNPETGEYVPVFNRMHIKTFLNRLKVYTKRRSICSYKYFICMEYGEHTKRQHYHALFFLKNSNYVRPFIDLCREIWSTNMNLGYMFPSPHGNPYDDAILKSKSGASAYASKYVTKDVSYFKLPAVNRLKQYIVSLHKSDTYDKFREYNNYMPRIYQSNGIGVSLLNQFDDFDSVIRYGIYNKLTKRYCPIPPYILNKFFYKNVPSFDARTSKISGKRLYDRILKVDSSLYLKFKRCSLYKQVDKIYNTLSNNSLNAEKISFIKSQLEASSLDDLSSKLAIYRQYVRNYSSRMLEFVNDLPTLFSLKTIDLFNEFQSNTYERFITSDNRFSQSIIPFFSSLSKRNELLFIYLKDIVDDIDKINEFYEENRILLNEQSEMLKESQKIKKYPIYLC